MRIKLETLEHQTRALKAIDQAFYGLDKNSTDPDANYIYANPLIKYRYQENANIDIKMETGTGKTYVYTRMMYEMHKKYGLFKFVIVVPTPSIKEGTRSFITSDYAKQHFSEFYENTRVQLNVINAGDFSNKHGRRNFPAQLSEFIEATRQNTNQIEVLLINAGMLNSKSMSRSDYDQTLLGGETCPLKAIAETRPIVIMDEPHRFPRKKKFYKDVIALKPQMIVRFGATFPETTTGRGKNKKTIVDYYRGEPQYNLNAIDSFNEGLVKGIDIDYPDISKEAASDLYKIKKTTFKQLTLSQGNKNYIVNANENLADVDEGFAGDITYVGGKNHELSNGLELHSNSMNLIPGTFTQNYQDEILAQAIDCHFKAEEHNFLRPGSPENTPKVKTLSLFFIDSISSFRGLNHTKGWLAQDFEKLLTEKLNKLIAKYEKAIDPKEKEYCDFLKATLKSLKSKDQQVYAGYFSEDRGSGDKAIQEEVDDILNNKEKLLSFKDKNGDWITRRFLFSKWTLREGWDNPNVFVIAKLRTSGSEISKIQEVGRGLRLPVDETGHRLTQDEFKSRLNFLIGYDEKDFANKLVGEVNSDAPIELSHTVLTPDMIDLIVDERGKIDKSFDKMTFLNDLLDKNVIDGSFKFKENIDLNGKCMSGYDALVDLYPEVEQRTKVGKGKIRNKNSVVRTEVKLRKSNWRELKDLWLKLSKRQMIEFTPSVNDSAQTVAKDIFRDNDDKIFTFEKPQMVTEEVNVQSNVSKVNSTSKDIAQDYRIMKYGKFLKELAIKTDLPVAFLNREMIKAMKKHGNDKRFINELTLNNLINTFNTQFNQRIENDYSYVPLNFSSSTSVYDIQKHNFVDELPAEDIGIFSSDAIPDKRYLYDRPPIRYDSADPELQVLQRTYGDKIVVYGKLPKRSIKIPRYDSGTSTPDFIFKVKRTDKKSGKEKDVYVVIETKAPDMRLGDEQIKTIQQKYFETLLNSGVYYEMATNEDQVHEFIDKVEDGAQISYNVTH